MPAFFRWRGQLRVDAPGRAYKPLVEPRAQLTVPADVHACLSRIANAQGITMRDAMDRLFADLRGAP